jgi:hypothetical protein
VIPLGLRIRANHALFPPCILLDAITQFSSHQAPCRTAIASFEHQRMRAFYKMYQNKKARPFLIGLSVIPLGLRIRANHALFPPCIPLDAITQFSSHQAPCRTAIASFERQRMRAFYKCIKIKKPDHF